MDPTIVVHDELLKIFSNVLTTDYFTSFKTATQNVYRLAPSMAMHNKFVILNTVYR